MFLDIFWTGLSKFNPPVGATQFAKVSLHVDIGSSELRLQNGKHFHNVLVHFWTGLSKFNPPVGPHNSLRSRPRAAIVYTCTEKKTLHVDIGSSELRLQNGKHFHNVLVHFWTGLSKFNPPVGPHNSPRSRPRAAIVYMCAEKKDVYCVLS